jgi:antirestriction protein ArdC
MKEGAMDIYDKVTQSVVRLLERGVKPWTQPWMAGPGGGMPLRHNGQSYRGINVLILWGQAQEAGYSAPYWMTYRQAQILGGQVRKGERSTPVVYYGTALKDGEGEQGEDGKTPFRFIRTFNVFNAGQIDGLPERYHAAAATHAPVVERIPELDAFVRKTGVEVRYGGGRAFYRMSEDFIQMPAFEEFSDPEKFFAVVSHELTHATRHPARLNRDMGRKRWGDEGYAAEELVAELGAAFLGAELGLRPDHIEDHAAYIASWLKVLADDRRFIFIAAAKAQEAADYLLGRKAAAEKLADAA